MHPRERVAMLITVIVGFLLAGAVIGRPWFLAVPVIAWPLYFVGLRLGWWGVGFPDPDVWVLSLIIAMGGCVLGAVAGVLLHRAVRKLVTA